MFWMIASVTRNSTGTLSWVFEGVRNPKGIGGPYKSGDPLPLSKKL